MYPKKILPCHSKNENDVKNNERKYLSIFQNKGNFQKEKKIHKSKRNNYAEKEFGKVNEMMPKSEGA